jgi:sugar phosphate isomerase/epimerase
MAEVAADIGFDGVDLTVRPGGHVLPENVAKDLPKAVAAIKRAGLIVPMMVTKITDPDDPLTETILKAASTQGIKFYRMGYIKHAKDISLADSLDKIKRSFAKLAALNKKHNIVGMYQNHSGDRFGGPLWDLWEVLKDMDPKWIGVQYDIRHAIVEGAYTWPQAMELLKIYIKTTAIKDFYWKKQKNEWKIKNCPLGTGMVDFDSYFKLYKRLNLSGPISMHFEYKHYDKDDPFEGKQKNTIKIMQKDLNTLKKMHNI